MIKTPGGKDIAIIGSGPAGLMAAEVLAAAGHHVTVYERLASPARKLLMAGRGGLNLTHSEALPQLLARYPGAPAAVLRAIEAFPPEALIAWVHGLGIETFVGSSGRIFPKGLKASPLLRAWLKRLGDMGVEMRPRHLWTGWTADGALSFQRDDDTVFSVTPDATLLALGGASWPRLGTDGTWVPVLEGAGTRVAPLLPANAGLLISWSAPLRDRFAGTPLKRIAVSCGGHTQRGEAVITRTGLEGGAVYALLPEVRKALAAGGPATTTLDLRPDDDLATVLRRVSLPRGKESLANFLRKRLALTPAAIALLREPGRGSVPSEPDALGRLIKALPLAVAGTAGLERAISTAGGVTLDSLDEAFMLKARPGVFAAGEMLDWEAPTGGYLLQASFATGRAAAEGILRRCQAL